MGKDFLNDCIKPVTLLSLFGAGGAIATKLAVNKFGRSFTNARFGVDSLALTASIGATQSFISATLASYLSRGSMDIDEGLLIFSHGVVGVGLAGLTALIPRDKLLIRRLTLSEGVALGVANYFAVFAAAMFLEEDG